MDTGTSQMSALPLWAQIPRKRSFKDLSHVPGTSPFPLSQAGEEFLLSMGHFGCTVALELCGATKMWYGCARCSCKCPACMRSSIVGSSPRTVQLHALASRE